MLAAQLGHAGTDRIEIVGGTKHHAPAGITKTKQKLGR